MAFPSNGVGPPPHVLSEEPRGPLRSRAPLVRNWNGGLDAVGSRDTPMQRAQSCKRRPRGLATLPALPPGGHRRTPWGGAKPALGAQGSSESRRGEKPRADHWWTKLRPAEVRRGPAPRPQLHPASRAIEAIGWSLRLAQGPLIDAPSQPIVGPFDQLRDRMASVRGALAVVSACGSRNLRAVTPRSVPDHPNTR